MTRLSAHIFSLVLATSLIVGGILPLSAQTLYYNRSGNPGWFGVTPWGTTGTGGPFGTVWTDGNVADFGTGTGGNLDVAIAGSNVAVAGLTTSGTQVVRINNGGTLQTMTFSGGALNGNFNLNNRVTVTGNLSVASGTTTFATIGTATAYSGTAIIGASGELSVTDAARLSATANVTVQSGGRFSLATGGSSTMGTLDLSGVGPGSTGALRIGDNTSSAGSNLTVGTLVGSGSIAVRANTSVAQHSLTVNGSGDSFYSGNISATGTNSTLSLTKSGAGGLTLSGNLSGFTRTTAVNGGSLFINSSTTSFGDSSGATAVSVTGSGLLGGTGTITTLDGDNVIIGSGGGLAAGLMNGTAGLTTYALGSGSNLDVSAATAGTGWLKFELGADTTFGTTYDQIRLSSGTLSIGSGLLNFADFEFTALSGFGEGTYTLFDNAAMSGTLASGGLSGTVGGFNAVLSLSGSDIILTTTAIPEPSTVASLLAGLGLLALLRRRHAA